MTKEDRIGAKVHRNLRKRISGKSPSEVKVIRFSSDDVSKFLRDLDRFQEASKKVNVLVN